MAAKGLRLGPHLAPLAPLAPRIAILNGVQVGTANHNTGYAQYARLKTHVQAEMPQILDIIGRHRDTQAVGVIDGDWIGSSFSSRDGASDGLLPSLESSSADECGIMSATLRKQARALGPGSRATVTAYEETAALLERLPKVPTFREEAWSSEVEAQHVARLLQRARWVFQNDLARCFYIMLDMPAPPWDTHTFNTQRQARFSGWTMAMLARFFRSLETTSSAHGPLSETVAVVIGSDVGRFPRLNGWGGKDHFPEIPLLLYGRAFNTGSGGATYGATDRRMATLPVSLQTGQRETGGHTMTLDDVGTTMLHVAGIASPAAYGYTGKILPFLV